MAKQIINIGQAANDRSGDPLRSAFNKVNENFTELYAAVQEGINVDQVNADWNAISGVAQILNKPTIPTDVSDLTDTTGLLGGDITSVAVGAGLTGGGNSGAVTINLDTDSFLGDFKVHSSVGGSTLGTKDNPDTGGWGGYDIRIDSKGNAGSGAFVYIPSVANQAAGIPLQIANTGDPASLVQLFGRGGVQVATNIGANEQVFEFAPNGTLSVPTIFPKTFTAIVDAAHYAGAGTLTLTGNAWHFEVSFVVGSDGAVSTNITNNTPWVDNPGYTDGYAFDFTEADHGIPGYTFTLTLIDIQNPGPAGWTTNLAASIPPTLPATIQKTDAIKFTAGSANWTFNSNGSLKLASGNGTIVAGGGIWHLDSANGDLTFPNSSRISYGLNNLGLTEDDLKIQAINTGNVQISSAGGLHNWTFGSDGILYLSATGDGTGGGILRGPLNSSVGIAAYNDTGAGTTYTLSVASTGQINLPTASDGKARLQNANGVEILSDTTMWTFGTAGQITLPGGTGELSSLADQVYLYSDTGGGQNSIDIITNGDTTLRNQRHVKIISASQGSAHTWTFGNNGSITFPDNTIQISAFKASLPPTHSTGQAGDVQGTLAFSSTHLYYCTDTYVDGVADIWKRVQWSADTW